MSNYATVAGIVQFDPEAREVNGKPIRKVNVRAIGSQQTVAITVWPEHGGVAISKGDFVVADGKFDSKVGQKQSGEAVTYYNLSASTLIVVPQAAKTEGTSPATSAPAAAVSTAAAPF